MASFEICFCGRTYPLCGGRFIPAAAVRYRAALPLRRRAAAKRRLGLALSYTLAAGALVVSLLAGLAMIFDNEADYIVNSLPGVAERVRNLFS